MFFPSYSYLDATYETFAAKYPDTPVVTQKPKMTDKERQEFLEHFDGDVVCGFTVMGGFGDSATTYEFASSNPLWKASLEGEIYQNQKNLKSKHHCCEYIGYILIKIYLCLSQFHL